MRPSRYRGGRFLVRERGRLVATPLFAVLVLVIVADLVFAVDSIPAIFGITRDAFVAFTSNALAVMGLRPLYFVLADAVHRFRFLRVSLAIVLGFVGVKMIVHQWLPIPTAVSLAVVVLVMGLGILASWRWPAPARAREPGGDPAVQPGGWLSCRNSTTSSASTATFGEPRPVAKSHPTAQSSLRFPPMTTSWKGSSSPSTPS